MTSNQAVNPSDRWWLGEKLIQRASQIEEYADTYERNRTPKDTKQMLAQLALEYSQFEVYVDARHLFLPANSESGQGFGSGEVSGTVVGFERRAHPYKYENGKFIGRVSILMYVASDRLYNVHASEASEWRGNIRGELAPESFVIGVPLLEGQKIADVSFVPPLDDLSADELQDLFAMELSPDQQPAHERIETPIESDYDYEDFVDRIKSYRDAERKGEITSVERLTQSIEEVALMNEDCPYVGKNMMVSSDYIRFPYFRDTSSFVGGEGIKSGIFQKFVYDTYVYNGEPRIDVQAVIYDPIVAQEVTTGKRTTEDADRSPTTAYAPLSLEHEIYVSSLSD